MLKVKSTINSKVKQIIDKYPKELDLNAGNLMCILCLKVLSYVSNEYYVWIHFWVNKSQWIKDFRWGAGQTIFILYYTISYMLRFIPADLHNSEGPWARGPIAGYGTDKSPKIILYYCILNSKWKIKRILSTNLWY